MGHGRLVAQAMITDRAFLTGSRVCRMKVDPLKAVDRLVFTPSLALAFRVTVT